MNLTRVLVALVSLNQDYVGLGRLQGVMNMANGNPSIRINHRSFRKEALKVKAEAIVFHDRILTQRRNLKIGMNEDDPLAPYDA